MLLSTAQPDEMEASHADSDGIWYKIAADWSSPNIYKCHLYDIHHILRVVRELPCPAKLLEIPSSELPIPGDTHWTARLSYGSVHQM